MKRVLCALVLAFLPAAAVADDGNYRPYLIGARAGGMGGAATALSDDASGPFYNPAGIAYVKRSQLSLSGSLFGVVTGSIADALGDGNDFSYSDLQTFPIQTSAVYKLGPDSAEESLHALAISIFVPTSVSLDDRDNLGLSQLSFFNSGKEDDVWAGATYARRFGPVALGASVYGLVETSVSALDLTAAPSPSEFANLSARFDELRLGIVGALGMRFDVTDEISLGLSAFSPEIGVHSSRRVYLRIATGDVNGQPATIALRRAEDLHASPSLPGRLQAGIAWSSGDVTLAADVILLLPRNVYDDVDRTAEGLNRTIQRNLVVNGSAGVEVLLTPALPFRAGVWTDLSASPEPSQGGPDNATRMDRIGGSLSIGLRSEHTESNINLNMAYAFGKTLIPDNFDFTVLKAADQHELGLYVVFASSFQF